MPEFWILSMELVSCHPSGTWSLVVAHRYLENLWTPEHIKEFHKKVLYELQFSLNDHSMLLLLPSHLVASYVALLTVYKQSIPLRTGPLAW
jgi:hypothetical protein